MKIPQVTTLVLENYYQHLLTVEEYNGQNTKHHDLLTASAVVKIHQLLRSCFTQAVKWGLIDRNPATYATVPKYQHKCELPVFLQLEQLQKRLILHGEIS